MKIAVIGSDQTNDYFRLKNGLDSIKNQVSEISSADQFTDIIAERWAKEEQKNSKIEKPDFENWGKSAYFRRKVDVINKSDVIVALSDNSKEMKNTIKIAKDLGKKVVEI